MKLDLLAFAAHPDDIELTCGGSIIKMAKKGYRIGIIDLTKGELGTRGDAQIRQEESSEAAKIMGVTLRENLGFSDGNIESNQKSRLKVIRVIRQYKSSFILLPYWQGRHFDHINCSQLVAQSAFYAGLAKIETGQKAYRPLRLIYYMCRQEFKPSFIVDISDYFAVKMKAIKAYKSQFGNSEAMKAAPTALSIPSFLRGIELRARYYGSLIGVEYGEPFYVKEALKIEDPLEFFKGIDPLQAVNTLED